MADIVRASQVASEVITATGPIAVRASQAVAEVIVATDTPLARASQLAVEVISLRYVTYTGTANATAGAAMTLAAKVVHTAQAMTGMATATMTQNGTILREFTGWGVPL